MRAMVEIRTGKLQGAEDRGVLVFKGIPYAAPPVGRSRFAAPQPPEPWSGIRDATQSRAAAPQVPRRLQIIPTAAQGEQSEDCLFLNVWTPARDVAPVADVGRRPVLVFVHGGSFMRGDGASPMYAGTPLAERTGIVVVTLNYRLGALGFTNWSVVGGERIGASANLGLLDQLAALRWVRENIAAFGGDPDNVTLCGESAGAMSVGAVLGMPAARGLFHRAILQSGAAHNVHDEDASSRVVHGLLRALELEPSDLERVRDVPIPALLEAQTKVAQTLWADSDVLCFQPTVDPLTLPTQPLDAIRAGAARDLPMIVGTNREEWNFFGALDPRVQQLSEEDLYARICARVGEAAESLLQVYAGTRPDATPGQRFCAIETDRVFRIPAIRLLETQLAHCPQLFGYLLTQASPALEGRLGACHALDLPFVFGQTGLSALAPLIGQGPQVEQLSGRIMDAWAAFMRDGSPQHAGLSTWPAYELTRRATQLLGTPCAAASDPGAAEREAWEKVL